jgi:hypothetical protein
LNISNDILSVSGTQVARKVLFSQGTSPPGKLVLTWTGTAHVVVNGGLGIDASKSNTIAFECNPNSNIWLDISEGTFSNLDVRMERHLGSYSYFSPDFSQDMSQYECIRFMDWQQTNYTRTQAQLANDLADGSAGPRGSAHGASLSFSKAGNGVPLKIMVDLCNAADTNGWFCLPIQADPSYIDGFLKQLSSTLKPGLIAYI